MDRQKTLIKQRKSTKSGSTIKFKKEPREYNPSQDLLNEELIARAVWECLRENDPDGVIEILEAHLSAKNKSWIAKEHGLSRTTLYHAFKSRNPTLHTLAKLVHATV